MRERREAQRAQRWRECWRVVATPVPGLAVAMPLDMLKPRVHARGRNMGNSVYSVCPPLSRVQWLGWIPDVGLVRSAIEWTMAAPPEVPLMGWTPCVERGDEGVRRRFAPSTDLASCGGLPYPAGVPADDYDQGGGRGRLYQTNWLEFVRMLPPDVPECLRAMGVWYDGDGVHWIHPSHLPLDRLAHLLGNGAPEDVGALEAGRRRRQMLAAFPLLASLARVPHVRRCADNAEEALPVMAATLKTSEHVVRFLGRVGGECAAPAAAFMATPWCLAMLEGMAPSWLPALEVLSTEGWEVLCSLSRRLEGKGGEDGDLGDRRVRMRGADRVFDCIGHAVGASLVPDASGLEWLRATDRSWRHLGDAAQAMACDLLLPAMARTSQEASLRFEDVQAVRAALLCTGVRRLARTLDMHLDNAAHGARLIQDVPLAATGGGWGQAAADEAAPSGRVLRFLSSQAELDAEGAVMGHCVAGYAHACISRSSAILSVGRWNGRGRGRAWVSGSTAELGAARRGHGLGPRVVQHYGPCNAQPPAVDVEALAWWLEQETAGRIALAPGSLRFPSRGIMSADDLPVFLGPDWHTPAAHAHRWDRWRRLLGTRAQSFGNWLLSLPPEFLQASPEFVRTTEMAVDMDEEMVVASEIEASQDSCPSW